MKINKKILLSEVFDNINNKKVKIKFNMNPSNPEVKAWDLLLGDDSAWTEMNAYKSKKNINNNMGTSDYLLAFAQYYPYGPEYFIFGDSYVNT